VLEEDPAVPAAARGRLDGGQFQVSSRSGRSGYRFEGEPLPCRPDPDRLSEPTAPGALQLPPDGLPLLLMADGNTIGGYPRLGHLASADRPRAAQLWPGDRITFHVVPLATAVALARGVEARFQAALALLAS
jgi:antagonist of KipI